MNEDYGQQQIVWRERKIVELEKDNKRLHSLADNYRLERDGLLHKIHQMRTEIRRAVSRIRGVQASIAARDAEEILNKLLKETK